MTIRTDIFLCFAIQNHQCMGRARAAAPTEKRGSKSQESEVPSMRDVMLWGQSFEALLESTVGRKLFTDFLRKEYSQENILFFEACEELDLLEDEDKIFDKVRTIYDAYISTLSPQEVSLDSWIRDEIQENMISPTKDIFQHAREHIYALMFRDSYPRFRNSDIYHSALEQSYEDTS